MLGGKCSESNGIITLLQCTHTPNMYMTPKKAHLVPNGYILYVENGGSYADFVVTYRVWVTEVFATVGTLTQIALNNYQ